MEMGLWIAPRPFIFSISRRFAFFGKQGLEVLGLHKGELAHNGGVGLIRERPLSNPLDFRTQTQLNTL